MSSLISNVKRAEQEIEQGQLPDDEMIHTPPEKTHPLPVPQPRQQESEDSGDIIFEVVGSEKKEKSDYQLPEKKKKKQQKQYKKSEKEKEKDKERNYSEKVKDKRPSPAPEEEFLHTKNPQFNSNPYFQNYYMPNMPNIPNMAAIPNMPNMPIIPPPYPMPPYGMPPFMIPTKFNSFPNNQPTPMMQHIPMQIPYQPTPSLQHPMQIPMAFPQNQVYKPMHPQVQPQSQYKQMPKQMSHHQGQYFNQFQAQQRQNYRAEKQREYQLVDLKIQKKKDFISEKNRLLKENLKSLPLQLQYQIIESFSCLIRYKKINLSKDCEDEIKVFCYNKSLEKIESHLQNEEIKESILKIIEILEVKQILMKVKEKKLMNKLMDEKDQRQIKKIMSSMRDPRKGH